MQPQDHPGEKPGEGNHQEGACPNKLDLPHDPAYFERGNKDQAYGLAQEEPYTPQIGQQAEHCSTELREQEAHPMYTGITLRPERRSAWAMENSPPLRRYRRGLLVIATYFPQNAGRSQAPAWRTS